MNSVRIKNLEQELEQELEHQTETRGRFVVGIDLGTTNSALAYHDRLGAPGKVLVFHIPQLVALSEMGKKPVLPSFVYLPADYELPKGACALPWDPAAQQIVGHLAREQGALVPGRLIGSAKSWLCHAGVDRLAKILPWSASQDVPKLSPVDASVCILSHMRQAWNAQKAKNKPQNRLENQTVILTVPASFDEVARELTVQAAQQAGLRKVILVEEPLAAFYAWLSHNEDSWKEKVGASQIILVCDVGGGTTDFSAIAVCQGEQDLYFERLAVGEHLLLGGDNMDLTLARHIELRMTGQVGKLGARRFHQLCHQCRQAKERLLSKRAPESVELSIVGAGKGLIQNSYKASITREEVQRWVIDGFFPQVECEQPFEQKTKQALGEWGLPFVQEPAITRHLAFYWNRFKELLQKQTGRKTVFCDHILFNGGALGASALRGRLKHVVQDWFRPVAGDRWDPGVLDNPRPELAVALGAVYYGLVRLGQGVRVGTGSPRSYYVQVESGTKAEQTIPGVCLIERGTQEGHQTELAKPSFALRANQPAVFQLLSSSTRLEDEVGQLIELPEDQVSLLPPIRTVLRFGKKEQAKQLPVRLVVHLTEVGTLQLWCQAQDSDHRWQLSFDVRDVRQQAESEEVSGQTNETLPLQTIQAGVELIRQTFATDVSAKPSTLASRPKALVAQLCQLFALERNDWSLPLIRNLADALLAVPQGRSLSQQHEARWLNLLGFCLRPGFGDALDEWRIKEVWKLLSQDLCYPRQDQCRSEYWIAIRRLSGGLNSIQQRIVQQQVVGPLLSPAKSRKQKQLIPKKLNVQEELEIWMALASLEKVEKASKVKLGQALCKRFQSRKPRLQELWALSRLGARIPFAGPLEEVVEAGVVAHWLQAVLSTGLNATSEACQALVQLARKTGDRARDLCSDDLAQLEAWLASAPGASRYVHLLNEPEIQLNATETSWVFGDSIPAALVIQTEQ